MVITGTPQIMMTRALTMKHALRLEVRSIESQQQVQRVPDSQGRVRL